MGHFSRTCLLCSHYWVDCRVSSVIVVCFRSADKVPRENSVIIPPDVALESHDCSISSCS